MHFRPPRRLFYDEHPSLPRIVRLALSDNERDRVDPYRMSSVPKISSGVFICPPDPNIRCILACFGMGFERVHDIRLGKREALEYLRQKATTQQYLWSPLQMCVHSFRFSAHSPSNVRLSKMCLRSRRLARLRHPWPSGQHRRGRPPPERRVRKPSPNIPHWLQESR